MRLKYEPALERLHISVTSLHIFVNQLQLRRKTRLDRTTNVFLEEFIRQKTHYGRQYLRDMVGGSSGHCNGLLGAPGPIIVYEEIIKLKTFLAMKFTTQHFIY